MKSFDDEYAIRDGRNICEKVKSHALKYTGAREVMRYGPYKDSKYQKWAVEKKLGVIIDSYYVPLVTASPELLMQFEGIRGAKSS